MQKITLSETISTDLLIVGTGIAGLSAAVEADKQGIHATLISKSVIGSGASYFPLKATLGIQITGEDDRKHFQQDIERVGNGRNNPSVVKAYIEDSPQAIELLKEIGFQPWRRSDNRPACFAQYSRPIYLINHWRDAAQRATQIIRQKRTAVYENATLIQIITEQNQVKGAVFSLENNGSLRYIFCQTERIILASGGIAGLYQDNLYPADVLGASHAIAQQAGAKLVNLAFIQFIPAFVEPKYKVLFGEHTLKYVEKITDSQGNDLFAHLTAEQFEQMMLERSHYAPFSVDFAGVEFDLVMMKHLLENPQEKGVYLHYKPALYQDQEEFYTVYLKWLNEEVGIHLLRDTVAIAPFAHSCNGGIQINQDGESAVKGLFAIGEISHCIEGANRLGGNSVGGGLVFAKRAVKKIAQELSQHTPMPLKKDEQKWLQQAEKQLNQLKNPAADNHLTASEVLSQIRGLMSRYANVYRTRHNLQFLRTELQRLEQRFDPIAHHQHRGIEIYYALKTAQAIVENILAEKTSLGANYLAS
ncbi:fumarate reductase [Pasteurellaceae bacterium Pebbles2]|nr:fumarate reductase [Pasteurellaceae bacterium Pebbles2]